MNNAPKLGIAITTYNRRAMLLALIDALYSLTTTDFDPIICDDGSSDDTVAAVRARGIKIIAGVNRGIAWNKNRGLFYLREFAAADIILLLDDDMLPVKPGWQEDWIEAVNRHGHINFRPTAHPRLAGANSPADPGIDTGLWGQCIATSRQALAYIGYFDTRFQGYGHEHTDFTQRAIRAGFGGFAVPQAGHTTRHFYSIEGGLKILPSTSSQNLATIASNGLLLDNSINEPIYRHAWRTEEEYTLLRAELAPLDGLNPPPSVPAAAPCWQADLGAPETISEIRIFAPIAPFAISIGFDLDSLAEVFSQPAQGDADPLVWRPALSAWGRFIRITGLAPSHHVEINGRPLAAAREQTIPDTELFKKFISLGDNCEFGLVQRAAGVEPLDLLRFGGTGDDETGLLLALTERFADFAMASDLDISEDAGEWISSSRRFQITFHTHRKTNSVSRATVLADESKRLRYLVRKLLDDFETAEKIFIRKSNKPVTDETMFALHRAVREIGPATLLWVTATDAQHPQPTVIKIAPGLLRGYISRLAPYEDANAIDLAAWRTLCQAALSAHQT